MKTTLAILILGAAFVLGALWWAGRSDEPVVSQALAPGGPAREADTSTLEPASLEPASRGELTRGEVQSAVTPESEEPRERSTASDAGERRGPAWDLPLEAAATEGAFDLARVPKVATGELRVWTFDPKTTWRSLPEGGVEVSFPTFQAGDGPEPSLPNAEQPLFVRAWGMTTGSRPKHLGTLEFDSPGKVTVDAAHLAHYDQVFLLTATRDRSPGVFLAALSGPAFTVGDRSLVCEEDESCTVLAWAGIESDGTLVLRRLPLPAGESIYVQARYAALYSLE